MAIKVNGTTVIDDSRGLQNIASVDATTVAAFSAAGVGGIATTTGAVGTYAFLGGSSYFDIDPGSSYAGSNLRYAGNGINNNTWTNDSDNSNITAYGSTVSPSGTWRAMGNAGNSFNNGGATVFLRIS